MPLEEKLKWDPDLVKRKQLKAILDRTLADFGVHLGGATSVDVTRKGKDKADGIAKLVENLALKPIEMLFIGDALFEGGNDQQVRNTRAKCIQVSGPEEVKLLSK